MNLMPCPFCQCGEIEEIDLGHDDPFFAVRCKRCLATVGSCYTWDMARESWNYRVEKSNNEHFVAAIEIAKKYSTAFDALVRIRDCGDSTEHKIARAAIEELSHGH